MFSRRSFAPTWAPADRTWIIPPSIDPFAPKNAALEAATVTDILKTTGLLDGSTGDAPRFIGLDASPGRVTHRASVVADRLPGPSEPVVLQVSRWDRLKDMGGSDSGFRRRPARGSSSPPCR